MILHARYTVNRIRSEVVLRYRLSRVPVEQCVGGRARVVPLNCPPQPRRSPPCPSPGRVHSVADRGYPDHPPPENDVCQTAQLTFHSQTSGGENRLKTRRRWIDDEANRKQRKRVRQRRCISLQTAGHATHVDTLHSRKSKCICPALSQSELDGKRKVCYAEESEDNSDMAGCVGRDAAGNFCVPKGKCVETCRTHRLLPEHHARAGACRTQHESRRKRLV